MEDKSKVRATRIEGLDDAVSRVYQKAFTVEVTDFDTMDTSHLYSIVKTVKDVTVKRRYLRVTWLVETVAMYEDLIQFATRLDNPSNKCVRSRVDGTWTAWNFCYAAFFPGV